MLELHARKSDVGGKLIYLFLCGFASAEGRFAPLRERIIFVLPANPTHYAIVHCLSWLTKYFTPLLIRKTECPCWSTSCPFS